MSLSRSRGRSAAGAAGAARAAGALLVAVLAVLWFTVGPGASPDGGSSSDRAAPSASATGSGAVDPTSGLRWVDADRLPPQARVTLRLVAADGPYPYSRDGVTFGNRERLLPPEPTGYYREFTVRTPDEDDRGARRIVAGEAGERYWTADHYASFQRVRGAPT